MIKQGAIIYIDFEPSRGIEIRKRRPSVVISRTEYNRVSNLIIVCPITSSEINRPYFVPLEDENLKQGSKVNTKQVYSLDYTEAGGRKVKQIGEVTKAELLNIGQHFLLNFQFSIPM